MSATMPRVDALRFLGVGGATAAELGNAAAVLQAGTCPLLLIDCGFGAWRSYEQHYGILPAAVFLTHLHYDHIGGLEGLFYRVHFAQAGLVRLFVPAQLVPALQQRVAEFPALLAEGGANFWDAFQLVPVGSGFWWQQLWFDVFAVRHHGPAGAYGLQLRGRFLYTGDTRPIPERIQHQACSGERIFHDCGLHANPSHTGLDDLQREYPDAVRARMVVYHYGSESDAARLRAHGLRVAAPGELFEL